MDFEKCLDIDCYTYKVLVREAFIEKMSASEEGRDYLEQAWCLTQTAPDREGLREHFKET